MRPFIAALAITTLSLVLGAIHITPTATSDINPSHKKVIHLNETDPAYSADKDVYSEKPDPADVWNRYSEDDDPVPVPLTFLVEINNATYKQKGYDNPFSQLYAELEMQWAIWTINDEHHGPELPLSSTLTLRDESDLDKLRKVTNVDHISPVLIPKNSDDSENSESFDFGDHEPKHDDTSDTVGSTVGTDELQEYSDLERTVYDAPYRRVTKELMALCKTVQGLGLEP